MSTEQASNLPSRRKNVWVPLSQEPEHPLAQLEEAEIAGHRLRVLLGPVSRFGARYFAVFLGSVEGPLSREPVLSGLHHSGPLPSYNWVEVAETNRVVTLGSASIDIKESGIDRLCALILALLLPGGHAMVEYDSKERKETARGLALGVPPIATPLGESLFRVGFGARFKDWQIAEGGSEGPRKLQAYKPPSIEFERRWREEASNQLETFLQRPEASSDVLSAARERARALLAELRERRSNERIQ